MSRLFPKTLTKMGWWVAIPSLVLALEQLWEKTFLTWNSGPQMLGFSLLHTGVGIPLILALFGGMIWVVAVVWVAAFSRSFGGMLTVSLLCIYAFAWAVFTIPYGFCQRLFVEKLAKGPHAANFLIYSAAYGDIETTKAFLAEGISVNVRNRDGTTPLHAAAVRGELKMAEFLVTRGADINALNRRGDSPLENAIYSNHTSLSRYLMQLGAKRVRHHAERDKRAISENVREPKDAKNPTDDHPGD